jgi:hypothetical protein
LKNLLIIYPHWPPSNLAGVHRPRLIANFTMGYGWKSFVLTVSPEFYEETPDPDMLLTVSADVKVFYAKAFKVMKPRIIGDLGLRAFPFLYNEAVDIISKYKIDFIWIPIPSFYTSLLGRLLYNRTSVPYGIDYIDPWVRDISNRQDWRSKLSLMVAKCLEPVAVKKASLISGVSENYYLPVLEKNFKEKQIVHVGMPYGFDPNDHTIEVRNLKYPWDEIVGCKPLVYAGAFLPNAHGFIKTLFKVIGKKVALGEWDMQVHLFFLGTGNYSGITIADYAEYYGIKSIVHEERGRFPYLHIQQILSVAFGVMAIGSTEKHYTASKIFQALLSKKPVLGIFHKESSAVAILNECEADNFLIEYNPLLSFKFLEKELALKLVKLISEYTNWKPNFYKLEKYSAKSSAKALIDSINDVIIK